MTATIILIAVLIACLLKYKQKLDTDVIVKAVDKILQKKK